MTPYDKLKSLPDAHRFLKPGVTFELLDAAVASRSDNHAARAMNEARSRLFQVIHGRAQHSA